MLTLNFLKTLVLLEYMICCGAEGVVGYARERLHVISTLREFQHIDSNGIDQGSKGIISLFDRTNDFSVRGKSREIVDLLNDEETLNEARRTRSVPTLKRRGSIEPFTISQGTMVNQENRVARRPSYEELQSLNEEDALAVAMRESHDSYLREEERRKSMSRTVSDTSAVYPYFLSNVSRASLAKSSAMQSST